MKYPEKTIIGLMSGTSLDGLDIAACKFSGQDDHFQYEIIKTESVDYSTEMRENLSGLINGSAFDLAREHFKFGYYSGIAVRDFLVRTKIKADFISSHGHTIFHQPDKGFTFQIGHGACIAAHSTLPVIHDFRALDVALGGQGAPLVPIGDKLLFKDYDYCLNLGGFSNISYDVDSGNRVAFDICPVNIVLNELAIRMGKPFDENGNLARSGNLNVSLLEKLESLKFYTQSGPKSLGKEWIDSEVMPLIDAFPIPTEDKLCTFSVHVARRISSAISGENKKVLVTGGGAFNSFLIEKLKENQKGNREIIVPDSETVMFKEALIFAFLGYLKTLGINNCLASVTGAARDNSGGMLAGES